MSATTFHQQLLAAKRRSSASAVIDTNHGCEFSYGDFVSVVQKFQRAIAHLGIKRQRPVCIALPNGVEFAVAFLAVTSSGLVAAPLNPNYKESEFSFYINDVQAPLILVPKGSVRTFYPGVSAAFKAGAAVAEVEWVGDHLRLDLKEQGTLEPTKTWRFPKPPKPEEVAFVLHTSGTTGRPKAVPLLHRNMAQTVRNIRKTYKLGRRDSGYLVMPLFHVHGLLAGFLAPLGAGGTVVIPPKFSASTFWEHFTNYGCNWYTAVPTIHQILLKSPLPRPVPKIRFIRSCSSSLAPATFHALEATFNAPVLEAYAMTEACHQMTSNDLPPGKRKPGTVGVGQGVEVAILDDQARRVPHGSEGEICIKGLNVTPGYINNPKANQESFTHNGFFRTGDQGKFDEDGFLVITGRIKELINRGGEKISPIELDGAMLAHPAVAEAVAFAAPDEMYGQVVNAAIVLKPDAQATEKDIQDFLAQKLAKFKIPQKIFFTKVMPKTATGKIQRRVIADTFLNAKPKAKL